MKDIHSLACCHRKWKFNDIRKNLINIKLSSFECIPNFVKNYGPQNKHHELNKLEVDFKLNFKSSNEFISPNYIDKKTELAYELRFIKKIKCLKINILLEQFVYHLNFHILFYCSIETLKIYCCQPNVSIALRFNEDLLSLTSDFTSNFLVSTSNIKLKVLRCRSNNFYYLEKFFEYNNVLLISNLIIETQLPSPQILRLQANIVKNITFSKYPSVFFV